MSSPLLEETPERLARLQLYKRLTAPVRAGLWTTVALLAAGANPPGGRPHQVDVGLVVLALYVFLERVTIPPRISGWRSDRRTKGALVLAFFIPLLVAFADRGRGPLLVLPQAVEAGLIVVGLSLVVVGGALRQWAIRTLGPYFTDRARVTDRHQLVQRGPYRWVRHPSYTGLVLVFAGFPLLLGSVAGGVLALVLGPVALALRIRVEEVLLADYFGVAWEEYAASTPRLAPRILARRGATSS